MKQKKSFEKYLAECSSQRDTQKDAKEEKMKTRGAVSKKRGEKRPSLTSRNEVHGIRKKTTQSSRNSSTNDCKTVDRIGESKVEERNQCDNLMLLIDLATGSKCY